MNRKKKSLFAFLATVLMFAVMATSAFGYFDRGPVKVTAAQNNVSVVAGKSVTVSISTSPSSDKQLPGCGMAECPQTCGEKNCLNADGECTCAGTTYQTYYTDVNVSSSNSSVAKASYSNGVLTIKGVSAGETDIKITAMLRQYTSTSDTIHVIVSGASNNTNTNINTNQNGNKQNPTTGSVEVVTPTEENTEENTQQPAQTDIQNYTVNSDKGLIHFVQIQDGVMGKTDMEAVMGKEESVVFQKKDTSGTVLYSWEFSGKNLKQPEDIDFNIKVENTLPENLKNMVKGNSLYVDFAHDGNLPGTATVNIQVSDLFNTDSVLNLYYYNEETGELELTAEQLKTENGYVSFSVDHCSSYVLTDGDLTETTGYALWIIIIAAVLVVIIAVIAVRRKKTKTA